jgi:hypothetical protein
VLSLPAVVAARRACERGLPTGYGPNKPYFYVYYTNRDSNNQISRFT